MKAAQPWQPGPKKRRGVLCPSGKTPRRRQSLGWLLIFGLLPVAAEAHSARSLLLRTEWEFRNAIINSNPELAWNGINFPAGSCSCTKLAARDGGTR